MSIVTLLCDGGKLLEARTVGSPRILGIPPAQCWLEKFALSSNEAREGSRPLNDTPLQMDQAEVKLGRGSGAALIW